MKSGYISVHRLKALKVLNMEKEAPLDRIQKEIEENLFKLKYKLEVIIRSSIFFFVWLNLSTNYILSILY